MLSFFKNCSVQTATELRNKFETSISLDLLSLDNGSNCSLDDSSPFLFHQGPNFVLLHFSSFSVLNFFDCNTNFFAIFTLELIPATNLLLNQSLNFSGLHLHPLGNRLIFELKHLSGIELSSNPFEAITLIDSQSVIVNLYIEKSTLDFFL